MKKTIVMRRVSSDSSVYDMVEHVIDDVFVNQIFTFNMYDYLISNKLTGPMVDEFIESSTITSINEQINELNLYIEGGSDTEHKFIREAYGYLGKPMARKIRTYLNNIISDTWRYKNDRKPGRRKGSKNRRKFTK